LRAWGIGVQYSTMARHSSLLNVQRKHKRKMRFQYLLKHLFLTLYGHNIHHQQWKLSKFLIRYQQLASHAYCWAARPVSNMASQQEKVFCVLRFEVSRSVITVQREFRARFKEHYSCVVRLFQTVHETHSALQSQIWTPQNGAHRKPSPAATPYWKLVSRPRSKQEKRTVGSIWETWIVSLASSVCSDNVG
jgi:hypothetical protein